MFSTGQIYFSIFFIISFVIVMIIAYRKDLKWSKLFYKDIHWILILFLLFIAFLFAIKYFLKE